MAKNYFKQSTFMKIVLHLHFLKLPYYLYKFRHIDMDFEDKVGLCIGSIQCDMEMVYSLAEVEARVREKINIRD